MGSHAQGVLLETDVERTNAILETVRDNYPIPSQYKTVAVNYIPSDILLGMP